MLFLRHRERNRVLRIRTAIRDSSGLPMTSLVVTITFVFTTSEKLTMKDDDDKLTKAVGARIRELRNAKGLSLRDVWKTSRVHPFHLSAIENGKFSANARTLKAIAGTLGVNVSDLLNVDHFDDDIGFIVEAMRLRPETARAIGAHVWKLVMN